MTRAEKEEQMSRAARWNEEQTAARTQPRLSQRGFWSSAIDRAANSNLVTSINNTGDKIANTTLSIFDELINPINQFEHTMVDANEATQAMQSGEIGHAVVATGKTALDELALIPFAGLAAKGVGYLTKIGAKVSFFGGGATTVGKVVKTGANSSPIHLMNEEIRSSQILEQLEQVPSSSVESSVALDRKLSRLQRVQSMADKTITLPNGSIRYFDKYRAAKKPGETIGSRFVTEYNPKTGDLIMWNETYNTARVVDRVHLKNINGFTMDALHHPPTLKELNMIRDSISGSSFRP